MDLEQIRSDLGHAWCRGMQLSKEIAHCLLTLQAAAQIFLIAARSGRYMGNCHVRTSLFSNLDLTYRPVDLRSIKFDICNREFVYMFNVIYSERTQTKIMHISNIDHCLEATQPFTYLATDMHLYMHVLLL